MKPPARRLLHDVVTRVARHVAAREPRVDALAHGVADLRLRAIVVAVADVGQRAALEAANLSTPAGLLHRAAVARVAVGARVALGGHALIAVARARETELRAVAVGEARGPTLAVRLVHVATQSRPLRRAAG